jgi:hypothetical protein
MNSDQLRDIMNFLRQCVHLEQGASGSVTIRFDAPSLAGMTTAGLDPEGSQEILAAPWWDEMIVDVVETPEMCEPEESSEQVLE